MASDAPSRTSNEPTFHRGFEDFIPWALGHVGLGMYAEGETEFFLQLTVHPETGRYYVWNRNNIMPPMRDGRGPRTMHPEGAIAELHGITMSQAAQRLTPPLHTFSREHMRALVMGRPRRKPSKTATEYLTVNARDLNAQFNALHSQFEPVHRYGVGQLLGNQSFTITESQTTLPVPMVQQVAPEAAPPELAIAREWRDGARYRDNIRRRTLEGAWYPGVRLYEGIELDAQYIMQHAEGRLWRISIEHLGIDQFLGGLNCERVDESSDASLWLPLTLQHPDLEGYWARIDGRMVAVRELYTVSNAFTILVVTDTTSGERTALRVPSNMRSAAEAVAWTFGMSADEYQPRREG